MHRLLDNLLDFIVQSVEEANVETNPHSTTQNLFFFLISTSWVKAKSCSVNKVNFSQAACVNVHTVMNKKDKYLFRAFCCANI